MSRNKARGTAFETLITNYLAVQLDDDRIDRRPLSGAKDRGDIGGVRLNGERVVIECKNHSRLNLAGWLDEATIEAGNDDAILGVVVHKRRGHGKPGEQYVTLTVDSLITLLLGGVK